MSGNGTERALTIREVNLTKAAPQPTEEFNRLALEPINWEQAIRVSDVLYGSGVLPEGIKSPGACVAIMMRGRELGMTTMEAIHNICVIKGKTSEYIDSIKSRVLKSGLCAHIRMVEWNEERCTIETLRSDGKDGGEPTRLTWTQEDVRTAQIESNHKKYPRAMLRHRCEAELLRAVYPEVTTGCYTPEEIRTIEMEPTSPDRAEFVEARQRTADLARDLPKIRECVNAAAERLAPKEFELIAGKRLDALESPADWRLAYENLTSRAAGHPTEEAVPPSVPTEDGSPPTNQEGDPGGGENEAPSKEIQEAQRSGLDSSRDPIKAQKEAHDGNATNNGSGAPINPEHSRSAPATAKAAPTDSNGRPKMTRTATDAELMSARRAWIAAAKAAGVSTGSIPEMPTIAKQALDDPDAKVGILSPEGKGIVLDFIEKKTAALGAQNGGGR